MKNCTAALTILALLSAVACKNTESPFARDVAKYAVVDIKAPDLSGISDNGKEVLNLYRFAADEVDAIYWAEINYGPWDRATGKSFVKGYADRLPGAGFYPADMTREEFDAWDNPDKNSPYTLIRRAPDGSLKTLWYHDAYKEHIDKIGDYLKAAADITIKPSVAAYLLATYTVWRTALAYITLYRETSVAEPCITAEAAYNNVKLAKRNFDSVANKYIKEMCEWYIKPRGKRGKTSTSFTPSDLSSQIDGIYFQDLPDDLIKGKLEKLGYAVIIEKPTDEELKEHYGDRYHSMISDNLEEFQTYICTNSKWKWLNTSNGICWISNFF